MKRVLFALVALSVAGCRGYLPQPSFDQVTALAGRPPDGNLVRADGGGISYTYRFVQGTSIDNFTLNFGNGGECLSFYLDRHTVPPATAGAPADLPPAADQIPPGYDPGAAAVPRTSVAAVTDAGRNLLPLAEMCRASKYWFPLTGA